MTQTEATGKDFKNFYKEAANDPEVLKARAAHKAELDAQMQAMLARMKGTVPDWPAERIRQMDRFCLEYGKRCIMWDDKDNGFFLLLNWDWLRNEPEVAADPAEMLGERQAGWYFNVRRILNPPLLDSQLEGEELAEWVDANTMRVHHRLLDKLGALRREEASGNLVLDDPYWQELMDTEPWARPQPRPASIPTFAEGLTPAPRPAPKP